MIGGSSLGKDWEFFSSPPRPDRLKGPPSLLSSGTLSQGLKRPWREADHSPPSSAVVENAWSYTSVLSIRLHGVVLSSSTGTVLPLPCSLFKENPWPKERCFHWYEHETEIYRCTFPSTAATAAKNEIW
jgi:hypothetical protein